MTEVATAGLRTVAPPTGVETPALCIDPAITARNIAAMQAAVAGAGLTLRPHVKTHKSLRIGRMQLAAGAVGITAATVGEAEAFADGGFEDIFVAYPVWAGGERARRVRDLHARVRLRVGIDSREGAEQLSRAVAGASPLEVVVEVDCGARRSGVSPIEAGPLAADAARLGLHPVGAFTYAGHGERSPDARRAAAEDEVRALGEAAASFAAHGLEATVLSGGSTPTTAFAARPPLTEVRPGEYVFYDARKVELGVCSADDVAAFVTTTVVSTAVAGQAIVDAGTKALGREGTPEIGYGQIPAIPGSVLRRLNEHHGYLALPPGGIPPRIGEVLAIVPNHVCPIVNLFDEYVVVEGERVVDRWPVDARGRQA